MARPPRRPRKVLCTCWFHCLGGRRVWKATYDRHIVEAERRARINENILHERQGHDAAPVHDVSELEGISSSHENSEDNRTDDEMNDRIENIDDLDDNIACLADDITIDIENDIVDDIEDEQGGIAHEMLDDVASGGDDPLYDITNEEEDEHSLDALRYAFIKMQSDWNYFNCPISCQEFIMRHLFVGLQPQDTHKKDPKFGAIFRGMGGE